MATQPESWPQTRYLPGTEILAVTVWWCACGARYTTWPDESMADLILWHQAFDHHGDPVPGQYRTWSLIRRPRRPRWRVA